MDSALLLKCAVDALGVEAVTALTAVSPSLSAAARARAVEIAALIGARQIEIHTDELRLPAYIANQGDRCFHCRDHVFQRAVAYAEAEGLGPLCYGAITDDLGDDRPGMRAAPLRGVLAPLLEVGFDKALVRATARRLGLPSWDDPADACLASRVPRGQIVTLEILARVGAAEAAARGLGLNPEAGKALIRARDLGAGVRFELGEVERARLWASPALRAGLLAAGRAAGYRWVSVDLEGYRQGGAGESA
ncbi:TIGR00268 family protein [Myxococcota bacterium]|nr:TIGR00268 family protein [Myxococcota bacterium]MBU1429216.1 TIGR00268 family protein [Myxococcota bacterium]MBU1900334.1 TIGR00268 family protein [Myxococcota bacterium]